MELEELNLDRLPHGRGSRAARDGIFCESRFNSSSSMTGFRSPEHPTNFKVHLVLHSIHQMELVRTD